MQQYRLPSASVTTGRFSPESRVGVTLTEVLMSLLVMSVAVSSVMILFPLSLLRSVQGRQLTQATILRYNAENQLDLHPGLANGLPASGPAILDPLGWHLVAEENVQDEDEFGWPNSPLIRTNGSQTKEAARKLVSLPDTWINTARDIPTDYYVNTDIDGNETFFLVMSPGVDLSDIPTDPGATDPGAPVPEGIARVTVFDPTARFSDARTISSISGDINSGYTLKLSSKLSPRVFDANNNLGEARIEVQEQRYTWLLTVRPSVRSADVVVFFRRSFSEEDEQIYRDPDQFSPVNNPVDQRTFFNTVKVEIDGTVITDVNDRPIPNRRILIKWQPDENMSNYLPKPFMRRNGFVFDVQNALWYRIHRIENEKAAEAVLVLDDVIKVKGRRGAILMRGIVDVYPISF